MDLDALSIRLLTELSADARLRTTELARRLGVSAPTVRERLARLEETGVIRGYRLDLDPAALGRPVGAWIRMRPGPGQSQRVMELAQKMPDVVECHRISGEDCYLLRVQLAEVAALEHVVDQFSVYGQTTTSFMFASPVPPRPVPLPT